MKVTHKCSTSLDYSSFTGRIAIGRLQRGTLETNQPVTLIKRDGSKLKSKIKELHVFEGLGRKKVEKINAGEICALVGLDGFEIGDTIADIEAPEALETIAIDEPTMSMLFTINDSPFFGKEENLDFTPFERTFGKRIEKNLALRLEKQIAPTSLWFLVEACYTYQSLSKLCVERVRTSNRSYKLSSKKLTESNVNPLRK